MRNTPSTGHRSFDEFQAAQRYLDFLNRAGDLPVIDYDDGLSGYSESFARTVSSTLTCDCGADRDEPHGTDCIHWDLPADDPSDDYRL